MFTEGKSNRKPVVETNKDGKFIQFFPSAKDAAASAGCIQVEMSGLLNFTRKHFYGRYFRHATKQEIAEFKALDQKMKEQEILQAEAVPPEPELIDIPEEIIPAIIDKPQPTADTLSPFERMLLRGNNPE